MCYECDRLEDEMPEPDEYPGMDETAVVGEVQWNDLYDAVVPPSEDDHDSVGGGYDGYDY